MIQAVSRGFAYVKSGQSVAGELSSHSWVDLETAFQLCIVYIVC